jgi:hypothetical protein
LATSLILGNIYSEEQINKSTTDTPNLDALEQKRDDLVKERSSILHEIMKQLFATEDKDKKLNDLKKQLEEENKAPDFISLNKYHYNEVLAELDQEIESILKDKYPEKFASIQKLEKDSVKHSFEIQQISEKDEDLEKLQSKRRKLNHLIELVRQISRRENEIKYELKPELKKIEEELSNVLSKLEGIKKDSRVKQINNKMDKLKQHKDKEEDKVRTEFAEELSKEETASAKKSENEILQLIKEISQIDPKIKELLSQENDIIKQMKAITKDKYPEEFKKIEFYDLTKFDMKETETFDEFIRDLSNKDSEIKGLNEKLQSLGWKLGQALGTNKKFVESHSKTMVDALKKQVEITHKLNPKIAEMDKELESLNKKCKSLKEKALIEINKKETSTK